MCYNPTVSLLSFTVMAISTTYLFYRNYSNDRWIAIIFASAGIMQLAEYFMWKDQSCGITNHLATKYAFFIGLIQPITVLIGAYYFGNLIFDKKHIIPVIWIYVIIFGIAGIEWTKYCSTKRLCSRPDGRHLDWNFENIFSSSPIMKIVSILYYLVVLLCFMSRPWYTGTVIGTMLLGTLFFSVFFVKNSTWKSWWCFVVNFIPVIYIIISSIQKKQNES
jgi:hypothetical protein